MSLITMRANNQRSFARVEYFHEQGNTEVEATMELRQKNGGEHAALLTSPEGNVLPAVFICIRSCSVLRLDTVHAHKFPVDTGFGVLVPFLTLHVNSWEVSQEAV